MENQNNLVKLANNVADQFDINSLINLGIIAIVTFAVFKFITSEHRPEQPDWKYGFLYGLICVGIIWFSIIQWVSVRESENFSLLLNVFSFTISVIVTSCLSWFFLKETNFSTKKILRKILIGIIAAVSFYIAISVFLAGSGSLAISISLGITFGAFFIMSILTIRGSLGKSTSLETETNKRRVEL